MVGPAGLPSERKEGIGMHRRYTVYRTDYVTGVKDAIGCIEERRKGVRDTRRNYLALLAEAREIFGEGPNGGIDIVMNHPNKKERSEEIGNAEKDTAERSAYSG
jgi:hypothetical protein